MNLGQRLRALIEEEILSGRMAPGQRLDERSLADRYAVSRTPVREALRHLASNGLVDLRPRQGAEVARLDAAQLLQMFEVLAELEALAARLCSRRMNDSELAVLERVHGEAEGIAASGDERRFTELNWHFHQALYLGSHNPFLAEELRALRLRVAPYRRWLFIKLKGVRKAHAEHDALVAAIRRGDEDEAGAIMRRHVLVDGDRLSDFLLIQGQSSDPVGPARDAARAAGVAG